MDYRKCYLCQWRNENVDCMMLRLDGPEKLEIKS